MEFEIRGKYINDKNKYDNNIFAEILSAFAIKENILINRNIKVGDDHELKLPDIYTKEHDIGYEVVCLEANEDFNRENINNELLKINHDKNKYLKIRENEESCLHDSDCVEYNGKIIQNPYNYEDAHSTDWMDKIYESNLEKKLSKLESGNYSKCKEINLFIFSIARRIDLIEIEYLNMAYNVIKQEHTKDFQNIYCLTTDGIWKLGEKCELLYEFSDNKFNEYQRKTRKILNI